MSRFSEASGVEKLKGIAIYSPLVLGPIIGTTVLADYIDRGYSEETVAETKDAIEQIDDRARVVLGEGNQCQVTIYNNLRSDNRFPSDREEIKQVLIETCETEPSDDTVRLLESYMTDLDPLFYELADQEDKKVVTAMDRTEAGVLGTAFGATGSFLLLTLFDYSKRRRQ